MLPVWFTFRKVGGEVAYFAPPCHTPTKRFTLDILQRLRFASIVMGMNFEQWLDDLIGPESRANAAKRAGYAQSTISRQLSRDYLRPETVIALCRAFNRSPVQGLIETGYINDYEVEGPDVAIALDKATNQQLLDQVMKRSDPQARYLFGGDDDVIGLSPHLASVSDASDIDDGTVKPFDYGEYAADSSEDETEARLERGEDLID